MRFVLDAAAPTTKKTSGEIVYLGRRCRSCGKGERPIMLPAANFRSWERAVAPQLRAVMADTGRPPVSCARCKGTGRRNDARCLGCAGRGARPEPIAHLVQVCALFYREANRGDLLGYEEALADALQSTGVLANDRQIVSWDGSRPLKDADRPRVEVLITPFDEPDPPPIAATGDQLGMFTGGHTP